MRFKKIVQHVALRGGGGGVEPKFLGKLGMEIGVYQKGPPIGDILVKFWSHYTFCAWPHL